jgi:phosphoribosylanthranilate isomerase
MSRVKICGLSRPCDIEAVNAAMPDYAGFVFAKSRRQIHYKQAAELKQSLDKHILAVGVFVNEPLQNIIALCNTEIIDLVQLHGDEDERYIKALKQRISNKIIKAVRVRCSDDLRQAEKLPCHYLLLDTYSTKEYGGTGTAFDWSMIGKVEKPFFLAGGINIENATTAINEVSPYCLDVSSGVETDGLKDRQKILQLVKAVKAERNDDNV